MDLLLNLVGFCSDVQKAGKIIIHDEDASEIQLNAFEFRNYRTHLEQPQHKMLERIVNQWCAMLVNGKTLKVNDFEEKVYLDKDMLNLEFSGELFPLKAISKMEMFKDTDDMMMEVPWGLDITFAFLKGDSSLRFNFVQERHRLNFALTLRILRTRDPSLDPGCACEVITKDDEEDSEEEYEKPTFQKVCAMPRFNVEGQGIPIVFSIMDLKVTKMIHSSSRHTYLEFFVRYPKQDKFFYAKSASTHIPQQVLAMDDGKKKKKKEGEEDEEDNKEEEKETVLCTMKFDMRNVKLRVPKAPHVIFGRLMAKDEYFPTVIGTFEFDVKRSYLQDRRALDEAEQEELKRLAKKNKHKRGQQLVDGQRKNPEIIDAVVKSAQFSEGKEPEKIAHLSLRVIGYVQDKVADPNKPKREKEEPEDVAEEEPEEDEEGMLDEESEEGDAVDEGGGWGSEEEEEEGS